MLSAAEPSGNARRFAATLALPVAAALLLGGLVVVAEFTALLICVSLLACVFVLRDFRIGVVLMIVLMPISASSLVPHDIGGINGLNPQNLLVIITLVSYLLSHRRSADGPASFAPKPLVWLYVVPITIAALLGATHVHDIAPTYLATTPVWFKDSALGYLGALLLRPLSMVMFGLLVGAAVARSHRPERFLTPTLVSVWLMCLLTIVFVFMSGISLTALASSSSRAFLSPLGIHANDLGRIYAIAYALMLFTAAETQDRRFRIVLFASMALVVLALIFTFSRSAFFGFAVVNAWFLLSRRKAAALIIGGVFVIALAFLLPGAVYDRMQAGWGADLNTISAGRIDHLWLPLLPEVWQSPIYGHGLRSIFWSEAMRVGSILPVDHPHSAYLQAALDMGIVGLTLLCAYFFHVWKGLRRLSADPALSPSQRGFYMGAAVGLVSFLVAGVTGSSLTPGIEQVFLWLAIGMMYGEFARKARVAAGAAQEPARATARPVKA